MAKKQLITLHPGEIGFASEDTVLATLLGSCVSIVLWHPLRRIGGMCHFMLPRRPKLFPVQLPDGRYGEDAMTVMLQSILKHKTQPAEYSAWLIGGARILADQRSSIGDMNVIAGREFLDRYNIATIHEHIGGNGYRRIRFDIGSGNVDIRSQSHDITAHADSSVSHKILGHIFG
jgi:chemotaxis protein CheD